MELEWDCPHPQFDILKQQTSNLHVRYVQQNAGGT